MCNATPKRVLLCLHYAIYNEWYKKLINEITLNSRINIRPGYENNFTYKYKCKKMRIITGVRPLPQSWKQFRLTVCSFYWFIYLFIFFLFHKYLLFLNWTLFFTCVGLYFISCRLNIDLLLLLVVCATPVWGSI